MGDRRAGQHGRPEQAQRRPEHASRPFDGAATASSWARAAGVVIVESLEHALARGATPIAEILGGALTADAFHISAPEPTGRGACPGDDQRDAQRRGRAGRDRLHRGPRHGHAAQRRDRDPGDQGRLRGCMPTRVAISSPKSMIGHLVGAAGIASALAAMRRDPRPASSRRRRTSTSPTPECDLDYVPLTPARRRSTRSMVNGFGFGGQNAVAVFRRYLHRPREPVPVPLGQRAGGRRPRRRRPRGHRPPRPAVRRRAVPRPDRPARGLRARADARDVLYRHEGLSPAPVTERRARPQPRSGRPSNASRRATMSSGITRGRPEA
jgi:hypothetical protein